MPLVRSETLHDKGFASTPTDVEHDAPPGEAVTVYPVTGDPPSELGASHDTNAEAFPGIADTPEGAAGGPNGRTPAATADGTAASWPPLFDQHLTVESSMTAHAPASPVST